MSEGTLDLKPESPIYKQTLRRLDDRWRTSARKMKSLHDKWQRNEELHLAYAPERDVDAVRRQLRENDGKPQYTTIILPYTYAMQMSAWSYWTTVFLARDPIFQYAGRHGEAEQQTQALEALIAYQVQVGEMLVPLYFWLHDAGRYGLGIIGSHWGEETTTISRLVEVPQTLYGMPLSGMPPERVMQTEQVRGYYGNKLFNIRPYDYYPDPRVPLHSVQSGEFVGYLSEVGWHQIARRKAAGQWVNTDLLKASSGDVSTIREPGSAALELPNDDNSFASETSEVRETGPYPIFTVYVDLVPSEWGLGEGNSGEKWVFECSVRASAASGGHQGHLRAIHSARPLGCYHNKFPIDILQMDPEPYAFASRGMPQIMSAMQQTMDWLVNSHMYNVRKTMNNQWLVDPSRVVMQDFLEPTAGGAIKATPAAYGTDLRTAMSQLPVADVTRGHMADIPFFHEFAQRAVGVNDQMMAMADVKSHTTAGANRTASSFGVNRQKTTAEFMSAMAFGPLGQKLVQNSQQYFDTPTKMRVVGDLVLALGPAAPKFMMVDPQSIQGFYDFVPVDGTMPVDRYAQAVLWQQLFGAMSKMPQLLMSYDVAGIFSWVAQLAGLKNINRFRINPLIAQPGQDPRTMMPGENVVPLKGPAGGSGIPEPRQQPGMGQTG